MTNFIKHYYMKISVEIKTDFEIHNYNYLYYKIWSFASQIHMAINL